MADQISGDQWESDEHPRDASGECLHPACRCFEAVQRALREQGVSAEQASDVLRSLLEIAGGFLIIPASALPQGRKFCASRNSTPKNSPPTNLGRSGHLKSKKIGA